MCIFLKHIGSQSTYNMSTYMLTFLETALFCIIVEKTTLASTGLKSPLKYALKCPSDGIDNVRWH